MRWLDESNFDQIVTTEQADDDEKPDDVKVENVDQQNDNEHQRNKEDGDLTKNETSSLEEQKETSKQQHAWFISRGAEICDVGEGLCKYMLSLDEVSFHCLDNCSISSINPQCLHIAQAYLSFRKGWSISARANQEIWP